MKKLGAQKLLKMEEEIKDILDFDEYSIFDDFKIEYNSDSEEYNIELKVNNKSFEFYTRFKDDEVDFDEYGSNTIEYNTYEDYWTECTSFDYTAKVIPLMLLTDACK